MKRSTKVPAHLRDLAVSGQRVRYNGFWLGDSERDRVIARYIDETPQVGAIIKAILFAMATGIGCLPIALPHEPEPEPERDQAIGAAGSALLDLDD